MQPTNSILKINNIEVKYHEVILVIKGVSIEVPEGGIVALGRKTNHTYLTLTPRFE